MLLKIGEMAGQISGIIAETLILSVPSKAVRDRAGNTVADRAGSIIVTRV